MINFLPEEILLPEALPLILKQFEQKHSFMASMTSTYCVGKYCNVGQLHDAIHV